MCISVHIKKVVFQMLLDTGSEAVLNVQVNVNPQARLAVLSLVLTPN